MRWICSPCSLLNRVLLKHCFFVCVPLPCACVFCAYAFVLCKTFPSKSPLLMCTMLTCVILSDTHIHASLPWWHNLYLDCQLACNQILFSAVKFVISIALFPLASFHTLLHLHTNRRTPLRAEIPLHCNTTALSYEAGLNCGNVNYVCGETEICVCECVCVYTAYSKSDFLRNTDFNFKSFPGTQFKGRLLINYVGKSLTRF